MQLWLVARVLLVLLRERNNFDRPRHLARAQNIDYAVVLETHFEVELLENTSVAAGGDSGLKERKFVYKCQHVASIVNDADDFWSTCVRPEWEPE